MRRNSNLEFSSDGDLEEEIAKIRGISDINRFLYPSKDELINPYLMHNIAIVGERIAYAIENNESVVVSYDPDADGLTSASAMIRFLREYIDNVDYIYNQRAHGHGIEEQVTLEFINKNDVDDGGNITDEEKRKRYELNKKNIVKISKSDLLIIIDSSSNDVDTCKELTESFDLDIVIIDHHNIEKENPYATIVNPQQVECQYPNKHLSGAGVTLKVMEVINDILDDTNINPFEYIDLVAVGMVGDMMRVDVLENRYIISHGLRNIKNVGLVRILKGANANLYKLNSDSISFAIAPMLNGVARLDRIELAIDILLTDCDDEAKKIRLQMHKLNEERKSIQRDMIDKHLKNIDTNQKVIIVYDDESSKGFNGLIAQQLSSMYDRHVIVGRKHKGYLKGSYRSYDGFNLKNFLIQSGIVEEAVGHNEAGGVTVKEENINSLNKYIENNLPELSERKPVLIYDFDIDLINMENYIEPLERFNFIVGNGFPKVIVKVNNVMIEDLEIIGKTMETCKIKTMSNLELIKFRVDEDYGSDLEFYDTVDVVGQLHMNEFYHWGYKKVIKTPQIILEDYNHV